MRRSLLALTVGLFVAACSDTPRVPGPAGNRDGGPDTGVNQGVDTGVNPGPDTGMPGPDTGLPGPDTGVPGPDGGLPDSGLPCNPEDGSGCTGGNSCFYVANINMAQCRMPAAMPKMFEEVCSQQLNDCAPGYACVAVQGEAMPTCKKVCLNGNDADCAGLQGASITYACPGEFQGSGGIGVCQGAGMMCLPYADMCPAMQYCDRVSQNATACQPEGTVMVNGACMNPGECRRGGACVNIGSGGLCYEPCDPQTGMCAAGPLCLGLQGLTFGICAPPCDVFNITCPASDTCQFVSSPAATGCMPASTAPAGMPCINNSCTRGNMCVNGVCRVPCDNAHPCAMGMCNMIQGGTIGICL